MTTPHPENTGRPHVPTHEATSDNGSTDSPGTMGGITLEGLISLTGEMEHLNELVMLHVERSGGFTCTASYLTIVTPILDMLEAEIRFRYRDGMARDEIKQVVSEWINREISGMNCRT